MAPEVPIRSLAVSLFAVAAIIVGFPVFTFGHEPDKSDPDRRHTAEYQQQLRRGSITTWYFSDAAELSLPNDVLTRTIEENNEYRGLWLERGDSVAVHELRPGGDIVFHRKYLTFEKERFFSRPTYLTDALSVWVRGGKSDGLYEVGPPGSDASALAVWSSWSDGSLCITYAASGSVRIARNPVPPTMNFRTIDDLSDPDERRRYQTLTVDFQLRFEKIATDISGIQSVSVNLEEYCVPHGSQFDDDVLLLEGQEEYFWRPLKCHPSSPDSSSCWFEEPKNLFD